jgi:S1-C subfamily serine protease
MRGALALALALAGLLGSPAWCEDPAPSEAGDAAARAKALEKARAALVKFVQRVRPSIIPVEVKAANGSVSRRQAVVVDAAGWLVMAGPVPNPRDTLVALLGKDSATPLIHVAADGETALTLLRMLAPPSTLTVLPLPEVQPRKPLPAPPLPGAGVLMVTSDTAVARGALRATDRRRRVLDGTQGALQPVTCLLEASLATVAADLGSPWFDDQGQLMGLLAGGDASDPVLVGQPADGVVLRAEPVAALAVPASVVAAVWPLLRAERVVSRARLGLRTDVPSEAMLAQLCPSCGGYAVLAIEPGGPGAQAGIEVNDLIAAIEGVPLRRQLTFQDALLPFRPLDPVTLTVVRRGNRMDLRVVLGAR